MQQVPHGLVIFCEAFGGVMFLGVAPAFGWIVFKGLPRHRWVVLVPWINYLWSTMLAVAAQSGLGLIPAILLTIGVTGTIGGFLWLTLYRWSGQNNIP